MKKTIAGLIAGVSVLASASTVAAQAYVAKPKLVVIVVIDQFRGDYLERYRSQLTAPMGFNLFMKKGAYFGSCYYDYANTKTAPGHSTIGTGAYTDGHGIAANEWWDLSRNTQREISSVEDERYRQVGVEGEGASPLNLRATTIGDEVRLATKGEAKLFGVSLKDRAAILTAGQTANGAFWIDGKTGRFVTSTYYMQALPEWAAKFDAGPAIAEAEKAAGAEGTDNFYGKVGATPAANKYELKFAEALIDGEQMGSHAVTDVLTVSLSANDILGHKVGPDAEPERQMVLALDKDLSGFFEYLDKKIGMENVLVALTADHGVAPTLEASSKLGVASAWINMKRLTASLEMSLNARFSPGKTVAYLLPQQELPYLALDPRAFGTVDEATAEQAVVDALPAAVASLKASAASATPTGRIPAEARIGFTRTRVQLAEGKIPATEFGRLVAHSYSDNIGWSVMLVPTAYQMEASKGTTHFSPWSYDRHVPLGFYGAGIVAGSYREQVAPVDIAATFASLLGVNAPSASVGKILTEIIAK